MSRRFLVGSCLLCCLALTASLSFAADSASNSGERKVQAEKKDKQGASEPEQVVADAEGTIPQQFKYIEQLQAKRPDALEAYLELQKQVQRTAEKILAKANKDSEDFTKAYLISRTSAIRTLSYLSESEQSKIASHVMDDVRSKKQLALSDAQIGMSLCQGLERAQRSKLAGEAYLLFGEQLAKSDDEQLTEVAKLFLGSGRRLTLVGKPMELAGTAVDGTKFNLADWKGKVVLVDFWATWCRPCLAEYPNVLRNYEAYHQRGFEVVGISLDQNRMALESYLDEKKIPWPTLYDEANRGRHPAVSYYGISGIPAMFLVGKDGNVVSMAARGKNLDEMLNELLGPPTATDDAEVSTPESAEGASNIALPPRHQRRAAEFFVSAPADDASGDEKTTDSETADDAKSDEKKKVNPYAAPPGMTTAQLVSFVFSMEEKPRTIQEREGFPEALIDAGERLIKSEKSGTYWRLGVLTKFKYLHKKASLEDKSADAQLVEFLAAMKDCPDKRIAKEVAFLTLERKAMAADDLPLAEIPALLDELEKFFTDQRLNERHLRLASATIHAVNRLDSDEEKEKEEFAKQRETYFTKFGGMFAKSTDKELSQYGNKLAKKPAAEASDLVGKPLELAGSTFDGAEFDWNSYRGKVVLVDFWATWCGPCIREMPNVRALYEENKEKGLEVVGVSLDKDLAKLGQFIDDNKVPWENLSGEATQELAKKYGVRGIPTMMLIDRDGIIVGVSHNVGALKEKAKQLIEQQPKATSDKKAG